MKLFGIEEKNKWGFINNKGEVVIEPKFDSTIGFYEELAFVVLGEKRGFIDKTGKMIIELPNGVNFAQFIDGMALINIRDKFGFINKKGHIVIKTIFDDARDFSEGLAAVNVGCQIKQGHCLPIKTEGRWGFVNKTGKLIIKPIFQHVAYFSEGLAGIKEGDKWGFINKEGKIVIKPEFDSVSAFHSKRASVIVKDKYGFINKLGKYVVDPKFTYALSCFDGLAAVYVGGCKMINGSLEGGKWGFVDVNGNMVIQPRFDGIQGVWLNEDPFHENAAAINIGAKYIQDGGDVHGGKWGFIDKKGKIIVEPQFKFAFNFSDGLAPVNIGGRSQYGLIIGGKWGYIDKKGNFIIKPKFYRALYFEDGLAEVNIDKKKFGYIDKNENWVWKPTN